MGVHQIDVVLTTELDTSIQRNNLFGRLSFRYYLYARADTVAIFADTVSMNQAIRDSLLSPDVAIRHRQLLSQDSAYRALCQADSAGVAYSRPWTFIDSTQLANYYTAEQITLILSNHLLFSPPSEEYITRVINANLVDGVSRHSRSFLRRGLFRLYYNDQLIIKSNDKNKQTRMLSNRHIVIKNLALPQHLE